MLNTKTSQIPQWGEAYQDKQNAPATRPRNVVQDKGVADNARAVAREPDPLMQVSRAQTVNTFSFRSQNTNPARVKLVHTTIHLHPLVRQFLEQQAAATGTSVSAVGAQALADWAHSSMERQHATTLKVEFRQIVREELQAFGHRIVFFLLRIALAAEQARILITNVLKLVLKIGGLYEEKGYYAMVDESAKLAKRNVIKNTPQLKSLHEEWEATFANHTSERKEGEIA